ncbi:oligosaccharide flippase family protein [Spirosoma knui]
MSTFKKLAGDTALYGISTILGRLLNYVLVPLQTYVFKQPAQLSSNVELYSYVAVLMTFYTLGLETAFFRFAARNKDKKADVFNETLSIVLTVSLVFSALLIGFSHEIALMLDYPGQERFIRWVALLVAIDAIMAIPFARLRVENKAKQFVAAKLINITLVVALNVFFLIFCRDIYNGEYLTGLRPIINVIYDPSIGPGYIFLANLIGNACYFILLRKAFIGFRPTLQWAQVRTLLVYSFPIMLTSLAGLVTNVTDRLFLRQLLPDGFYTGLTAEDALGIYGNCYKLSVFMALAIQSFKFAADPFFFSQAEDKNAPGLLAEVTKWFVIVCVLIWLGVSLNLDVFGLFLSARYRSGLDVVPVLLLANLFLGVYYNISFWFKLSDKTVYGTVITIVGAIVVIGLNIWLIPQYGYMGCALAFLASSFTMMALCYVLGERYYPVPYHIGSAVGYVVGAGLLIYGAQLVTIQNLWLAGAFHLVLVGLFVLVILIVERATFQPLFGRLRSRVSS